MSLKSFKILLLLVSFSALLFISSCTIPVLLTKNKTRVPDSIEGVWSADDNPDVLTEVRKKDDFWVNMTILDKGKKSEPAGITFHDYDGLKVFCTITWENGERNAEVMAYQMIDDNTIHVFTMDFKGSTWSDQGQYEKDFKSTPFSLREPVFEEYLKSGKITISEKPGVFKKRYSLN